MEKSNDEAKVKIGGKQKGKGPNYSNIMITFGSDLPPAQEGKWETKLGPGELSFVVQGLVLQECSWL